LDDIAHTRADEFEEDVDTLLCSLVDLDRSLANRPDTLPNEIDINFRSIPVQLSVLFEGRDGITHSFNSLSSASTFLPFASRTMMSSFSTFTYSGSLYLQKKTLISLLRISGLF